MEIGLFKRNGLVYTRFKVRVKEKDDWILYAQEIILRNGYGTNAPCVKVLCALQVKTGNPEWGAESDILYYVLKIQKIIETVHNEARRCG